MPTLQHATPFSHTPGSSLLLIDFDQTLTRNDTIGFLGEFGVSHSHATLKPWSYFVDSYLEEYRGFRDHLPDIPKGDFNAYIDQLDSYRPIEENSLARVSQHQVFANIHRKAFVEEGKRLRSEQLQAGVVSVLKKYRRQIRIVSVNWSKDWILGFLAELKLDRKQIYSNDLTFDQDKISTGQIVPQIVTTGDKQRVIDTFKKQNDRIFFIGDSLGDILPLVKADIGIVVGKNKSLLDALKEYGFTLQEDVSANNASSLYRVDTWNQVKIILDKHF